MNFEHKETIRHKLADYLKDKGIDYNKRFNCFDCSKKHMSYKGLETDGKGFGYYVKCYSCQAYYDIFSLIQKDYGLNTFREQYQQACILFGLEDEFNKHKYKKTAKQVKNNIAEKSIKENKNIERYNKFYDKLCKKERQLTETLKYIDDPLTYEYQEIQFKIDFISEYTKKLLEYNKDSIALIEGFNEEYNKRYEQFKKYTSN